MNPVCFLQTRVQPVETDASLNRPETAQRVKFDPKDWMDSANEDPETPEPLRFLT